MPLRSQGNKQRHRGSKSGSKDDWLITYSDAITLLLAFFLLLLSVSEVNMAMFEQLRSGIQKGFTKDKIVQTPLLEIKYKLDSLLYEEGQQAKVRIDLGKKGIVMQFASSTFYEAGQADINTTAQGILDKVTSGLTSIDYYPFSVDIEGHTDDTPISTLRFPSNWELSVARATNIVKYMIESGLHPQRLKAAGYADTKPLVPNRTKQGEPLAENQARNRRIVIRVH
jgi:chemotaxis protein MotB